VPLQGDELTAWRAARRAEAEAQAEAAEQAASAAAQPAAEQAPAQAPSDAAAPADAAVPMDLALVHAAGAADVEAEAAALCASRHPCLVDGFALPPGCAAPMFPFEPRVATHSDYGDLVNALDFADGSGAEGAAAARRAHAQEELGSERLALPAPGGGGEGAEQPTRVATADVSLQLACVIVVIDFGGLADGRSVRNTLAMLQPCRVVLVHGSADATQALAEHAAGVLPGLCAPVAAPRAGQRCDMSAATPSLRVRLADDAADAATAALAPAGEGTYAVAWLEGVLCAAAAPNALPVVCAPPAGAPLRPHRAAFVADFRFSDLLHACSAAGIPAEFSAGGVLLCGRGVSVRKAEGAEGELLLEGALSEDYFRVRDLLYAQHRVI
jgi:cleavage and polyadenylation specificity factor subunit 2